ncbi:ABC1 kinase family protein [Aquirhabdus parva]|uniref:2-octaprenylphenol hydroxylase n=1 Tax=Aquirhabdus parva TaxID=2283318 RepID=A0A345P8W6_9GAMM|nr:AarF/UbiB family protein [Aquirhabdus parva]AXI03725.1 2-octaprenylphenol hydroxylase [Aquirhabdus parva]
MIPHRKRLLELWRIAAHYRLDTLIPPEQIPDKARPAMTAIRLHPAAWNNHTQDPLRLKNALQDMGVLFIKLGQLLSTRRDLIPPALLDQLTELQDRVTPFPYAEAKARVESSLGATLETLFARFDPMPLAAASIAQVHTAAFHDGREVIVKIVRPNIRPQIIQDFEILAWIGHWLEVRVEAARALHLSKVIDDYRQVILNELDLDQEAANTMQMRHNFLGSSMMYVPEVYRSTRDIMIAERIVGAPVSDLATFERLGMDRARLAEKGLTIFFTQVFRDNFFHADMHPGNVFVETINPAEPRFIALDCAIVGELSDNDRLTIARMLLAVIQSNFSQLIQIVHQAGWIPQGTDQNALTRDMRRVVSPMISKPMDQLDFAGILMQVMDIARRYRLDIPPQLMLLIKTLVHVEGLGRDLYPQLDIWKLAKPILTEWVSHRMNPVKAVRDFGQQIPDLLMGATDLPALLIDSLHGMRQQGAWQDRQWRELQQLRMDIVQTRRRDWLAGSGFIALIAIASNAPWPIASILIVVAFFLVLWRVLI